MDFYQDLRELGEEMSEFHASNGWLQNFCQRHGIKSIRDHGEAGSVDPEVAKQGRKIMIETTAKWRPEDIYNADETGLYYRQGPSVRMHTRKTRGKKVIKDRITVLVCANATGTDK